MSNTPLSISSSERRWRWAKILAFICTICISALLFQYFFERKIILGSESSAAFKINKILYSNDQNEVPILGPSTAQSGFIPSILGADFFNYGIDGVGDNVVLFFLSEECKKKKINPNIIVVLRLEGMYSSLGDRNSYIYNSNNPDVKRLLDKEYKFYYAIPFVKYYGEYDSYLKDYLNERMQLTKYKDRGASIEKDEMTKERFNDLVNERKNTVTRFSASARLKAGLDSLIRCHPERNLIFVIPPVHSSCFEKFVNYDAVESYLAHLDSFSNVHVLNYARHFYPDDCYLNTTHLNYKGAIQFNRLIKDTLQKIMIK